ncbi:Two-component transcriptional response regulator, LuxR family [hydrothermal vent metagenome]|uniref:Two-component transcriptional response regulator, LuxR family n=1 Tax=hydrothermal vent metagenome TaxID=652676 RepID=A0A3B0T8A3_9ZZZZ
MNMLTEMNTQTAEILLVDDDDDLRHALSQGLEIDGFNVKAFASAHEILPLISPSFNGIIVSDMRMNGIDGNDLLQRVLEIDAALPLILITGHGDVAMAVSSMRSGAYDFIEKPFATAHLSAVISRALEKRRLVLENRQLRENFDTENSLESRLVGYHPLIVDMRAKVMMLGATEIDVLLTGETGTGKDVVARSLHDFGPRKSGPFVAINCGALPAEIIESELFGHEAGAFTGAQKLRIGKMEHANGGTLFLDEIESMPLQLQVKLLRVVENRCIERLGSNTSIPLDIRLVAASKTDLGKNNPDLNFRQDLYFRLNVASIALPSLRERGSDILLLFHHLTRLASTRLRCEVPKITRSVEVRLTQYKWPGNIRELRNAADRFVLGLDLGIDEAEGQNSYPAGSHDIAGTETSLPEQMASYERGVIANEIARNNGALKPTYENLRISRKSLYEKMKRFGLDQQNFRSGT